MRCLRSFHLGLFVHLLGVVVVTATPSSTCRRLAPLHGGNVRWRIHLPHGVGKVGSLSLEHGEQVQRRRAHVVQATDLNRKNIIYTSGFLCCKQAILMERHTLKTNIYSYLETSGGQSSNPYLNSIHFFNPNVN